MAVVVFPQDGAPRVAKRLLWELDAPGPLPLLPPGPGKDLQAWGPSPCSQLHLFPEALSSPS